MPNLGEHYDDGGNFLPEGEYNVAVGHYETVKSANNNGIQFTLFDNHRREIRIAFWLTEKALWRLAQFAKACGLTKEQCTAYDPYVFSNHQKLMSRRLMISVAKGKPGSDGKCYNEVAEFWVCPATQGPLIPGTEAPASSAPSAPIPEPTETAEDDIPF